MSSLIFTTWEKLINISIKITKTNKEEIKWSVEKWKLGRSIVTLGIYEIFAKESCIEVIWNSCKSFIFLFRFSSNIKEEKRKNFFAKLVNQKALKANRIGFFHCLFSSVTSFSLLYWMWFSFLDVLFFAHTLIYSWMWKGEWILYLELFFYIWVNITWCLWKLQ